MCGKQDWGRGWSEGGCYLHLEASEFIEAVRGKGNKLEEAGDVLFVFLSMLIDAGIDPEAVLAQCDRKIDDMELNVAMGLRYNGHCHRHGIFGCVACRNRTAEEALRYLGRSPHVPGDARHGHPDVDVFGGSDFP